MRNHDLLKEVVKLRHEFSKQECEHQNYISGLKYRYEKETQNALNSAEAEKYHFEFEIKTLEEELDARSRIRAGEEERMASRQICHDNELDTLRANFEKSEELCRRAQEYMDTELHTRHMDGDRIMGDIRDNYERKLGAIRDENERVNNGIRAEIEMKERELEGKLLVLH